MTTQASASKRVLFYSHDTLGLGHLRRTILLARGLTGRIQNLDVLIVTGAPMAHTFRTGPNIDYVKLPSVLKVGDERYGSRTLHCSFDRVRKIRARLLLEAARTYRPTLFFVDNVPLGMRGEAEDTLRQLRARQPECRVCLTLRDVIDDPGRVIPLWQRLRVFDALERYYHAIFVYGQKEIFDVAEEYAFPPSVRAKTQYCGYLPRTLDPDDRSDIRRRFGVGRDDTLLVATVGGGSDGGPVIEAFLQALPLLRPRKVRGVVLLGPDLPSERRDLLRAKSPDLGVEMMEFSPEPLPLFAAADLVVSMGGYNTVSEILALGKRAIVVPRVTPRREQLIRCERLQRLNLLHVIHPATLTAELLARRARQALSLPAPRVEGRMDFAGLDRLVDAVGQSFASFAAPAPHAVS